MRILVAIDPEASLEPEPVAASLAALAAEHELIVLVGSGRDAGLLALALRNQLPDREVMTVLLQAITSVDGPDFASPPSPQAIASLRGLRTLLDSGALVVCATGCVAGVIDGAGAMRGIDVAIGPQRTAPLLARRLDADKLLMLGDGFDADEIEAELAVTSAAV